MASFSKLDTHFVVDVLTAIQSLAETAEHPSSSFSETMASLFPVTTPDVARTLMTTKPVPNSRFNPLEVLSILTGEQSLVSDLTLLLEDLDLFDFERRVYRKSHGNEMLIEYRQSPANVPVCRCFLASVGIGFGFEWTNGVPLLEAARIKRSAEVFMLERPGEMWRLKTVFTGNSPLTLRPNDSVWTASTPATVGVPSNKETEDTATRADREYDRVGPYEASPPSYDTQSCATCRSPPW